MTGTRRAPWWWRMARGTITVQWRHRWHVTPVWAAVWALLAGVGAPLLTALSAAVAGAVVWVTREWTVRGRRWLSARERQVVAVWLWCVAGWALLLVGWPGGWRVLPLVVAWPSWQWWRSRRVRRTDKAARELTRRWVHSVPVEGVGPAPWVGSHIIPGTGRSPSPGSMTMRVQLDGAHQEKAAADDCRLAIEALMRLPARSLQLDPVDSDVTQVKVTLTPTRHLETSGTPWAGPVMTSDGRIPVGSTRDGRTAYVQHHDESGVWHTWLSGTTGAGKSRTLAVLLLPGVVSGKEVVWYADGAKKNSLPKVLRPAMARIARDPAEWGRLIDAAYAVMESRQDRRDGIDTWDHDNETDPVLTLVLEEATAIKRRISPAQVQKVLQIKEQGRKCGVRVIQVTQGTREDTLIGGTLARALMREVVAHRPGGSTASTLALDGSGESVNLLRLPPGPGWCAVLSADVLTHPVRISLATDAAIEAALEGVHVSDVIGADSDAALDTMVAAVLSDDGQPESADVRAERRASMLALLRTDGPLTLQEVTDHPTWPLGRRAASGYLSDLAAEGLATKDGLRWAAVAEVVADVEAEAAEPELAEPHLRRVV